MKKLIILVITGLIGSIAPAQDFKNPYANKNLGTHTKEFLAHEIISDFHKGVAKYNQERKDLPEAKFVINHYEISDGKNKVEFNINLALKGDFYYNDVLTNIKDYKEKPAPKIVFFSIISDAEAAEQLSTIMLAALVKLEPNINRRNTSEENRKLLMAKIQELYTQCMYNDAKDQYGDLLGDVSGMKKLLEQINENAKAHNLTSFGDKEHTIVEKALSREGFDEPNCGNDARAQMGISYATARENQNMENGAGEYGNGIISADAIQKDERGNIQTVQVTARAKAKKYADQQICTQLAQLKSCIANTESTISNSNNTSRKYLKEVPASQDDLRDFYTPTPGNSAIYH